jgi:calpain-7
MLLALIAATLFLHPTPAFTQTRGPVKDLYNMQDNPQLSFVTNASEATEIFVLLSRHITDAQDFCDNKEFITVHVYRGGQRIFYPEDAFLSGTKINRWESL